MPGFVWWVVIGLVAGLMARMLVPGDELMDWLKTAALGLAGSVVGGLVSWLAFGADPRDSGFQTSGLLLSTVGAVLVLGAYVAYQQRRPMS